ncbi:hypothetical protein [Winogradskyella ouciana]|uniref:Uncharacterized protein n=1 Tax=Winogradskyella ouciana TaxID=2608631 RepID=A0A7K1G9S6_9FLAO|nr:hypothetical protein [Winogradskyella ouciana]
MKHAAKYWDFVHFARYGANYSINKKDREKYPPRIGDIPIIKIAYDISHYHEENP